MTKLPNPITIYKDTSPYLYLTDSSGIMVNEYQSTILDRGIYININEENATTFNLVSFQLWFRYPNESFGTSAMKLFSIQTQTSTIDFMCTPLSDTSKARITTSEPSDLYKNGNYCSSFIIHSREWASLYVIFENPIQFDSYVGKAILHPNFVFNNVAQYIYENEIGTIITATNINWELVWHPAPAVDNTWQDVLDEGTWQDVIAYYNVKSDFVLSGDYLYGNQVGTSVIVNDDLSNINTYANGVDIFADVEWQKIEKSLV